MNRDYWPSKQFITRVVAIAIILVVFLGIYEGAKYINKRLKAHKGTLVVQNLASIQKDSNDNGIPDWEESLWGLDPSKNGPENKEFITAKRNAMAQDHPELVNNGPITENDALSRDFFSIIMSLQQSGTLDQSAVQAVGDAIGKKIEAEPIADVYTRKMVNVVESTPASISDYYESFINLAIKYGDKNMGDELIFINQGLQNKDPNAVKQVKSISDTYRAFGKEFIKVPVPNTLVNVHLALANDYEKVGLSVAGLKDVLSDPLNGVKSFINYKKYLDLLTNDMNQLSGGEQ